MGLGKPTEMSLRDLLVEELRRRGVVVAPEVSFRVEIDRAILKVLGFNEQETNQILDYLYPALTKEIEQLKTLMQG